MHGATLIEKEELNHYHFPAEDVLKTADARLHRKMELERATTIGNAHRGKVKLVFHTREGLREVETTVWAATESFILLKGEVTIPVHAIEHVVIY